MKKLNLTDKRKPDYFYSEAIKTLRTNIQLSGQSIKTILVTSCFPNEGKSDVVLSLAQELGSIGKKFSFLMQISEKRHMRSTGCGRTRASTWPRRCLRACTRTTPTRPRWSNSAIGGSPTMRMPTTPEAHRARQCGILAAHAQGARLQRRAVAGATDPYETPFA